MVGTAHPTDQSDRTMQPNDLEQLLQRADRASDVDLASPTALANRARHRVRRQKQVRAAVGTSVGIALLLFVFNVATRNEAVKKTEPQIAHTESPPEDAMVDLMAKIEALRAEADRLEAIVRASRQAANERTATASYVPRNVMYKERKPQPIPVSLLIEQESEITARVMVEQAIRWMSQGDRQDEAIRSFERTINLFPTTAAAKTARARLSQIKNRSGATI